MLPPIVLRLRFDKFNWPTGLRGTPPTGQWSRATYLAAVRKVPFVLGMVLCFGLLI
jgi:hypothetical protein